tara:strand:- start:65 stop:577 length:513 start_codon:yes stop_codon:yes gene_type:complete
MKISEIELENIIREEIEGLLSEKCWPGYEKKGMKTMFGKRYPNCVKKSKKKKRRKKRKNENNNIAISEQELENIISEEIAALLDEDLRKWFNQDKDAGGPGKGGGWVDCNTCRKDKKTGRKKCKPCGRQKGEKRKYPACRPTAAACGKRGKWGKKSKARSKKRKSRRKNE